MGMLRDNIFSGSGLGLGSLEPGFNFKSLLILQVLLIGWINAVGSSPLNQFEQQKPESYATDHKPFALGYRSEDHYHSHDDTWFFRGLIIFWCYCALVGIGIIVTLALCFCPHLFPCKKVRSRRLVLFSLPRSYRTRGGLYQPGNRCYNFPVNIYQVPGKIHFIPPPEPVHTSPIGTATATSTVASLGAKAAKTITSAASTAHTVLNNLMPKYEASRGKVYSSPSPGVPSTAGPSTATTTSSGYFPVVTNQNQQQPAYNPNYN